MKYLKGIEAHQTITSNKTKSKGVLLVLQKQCSQSKKFQKALGPQNCSWEPHTRTH